MNQTDKPVPRAERMHPGSDSWVIYASENDWFSYDERNNVVSRKEGLPLSAGHLKELLVSAKLREQIQTKEGALAELRDIVAEDEGFIRDLICNGNRVAAELGLPEGSGVDEVIAAVQSSRSAYDTWTGFFQQVGEIVDVRDQKAIHVIAKIRHWKSVIDMIRQQQQDLAKACAAPVGATFDDAIQIVRQFKEERRDALQQIDNLGRFIGHPGATPAHVVSETVSLIEKFVAGCRKIGITAFSNPVSLSEAFISLCNHNKLILTLQPVFKVVNREAHPGEKVFAAVDPGFDDARATFFTSKAPENHPSNEGNRLIALRDDKNLPVELRRQAAIAFQMWHWFHVTDRSIAPSECLERGLPLLPEDEHPLDILTREAQEQGEYDPAEEAKKQPEKPRCYSSVQELIDENTPERSEEFRQMVGERTELHDLRKFHRIVCRMHGVTYPCDIMEALHQIAEKDNASDLF